jgi:hypothetical protein
MEKESRCNWNLLTPGESVNRALRMGPAVPLLQESFQSGLDSSARDAKAQAKAVHFFTRNAQPVDPQGIGA